MAGNLGVDQLGAECLEPAERPLLVAFDQARIAGDRPRGSLRADVRRGFALRAPCGLALRAPWRRRLGGGRSYPMRRPPCIKHQARPIGPPSLCQDRRVTCVAVWDVCGRSASLSRLLPGYGKFSRFSGLEIAGYDTGDGPVSTTLSS